jgi:hypothetical protein
MLVGETPKLRASLDQRLGRGGKPLERQLRGWRVAAHEDCSIGRRTRMVLVVGATGIVGA